MGQVFLDRQYDGFNKLKFKKAAKLFLITTKGMYDHLEDHDIWQLKQ